MAVEVKISQYLPRSPREALIKSVIPAKLVLECLNRGAGIHLDLKRGFIESKWIPAFAGMTIYGLNQSFPRKMPASL